MSHEKALEAAAEVIWNARDARMGGAWNSRDRNEIVVLETIATAEAAIDAYLSALVADEVAGVEPAGWRWKTPVEDDYWVWSYNTVIDNPDDTRCEPLYSASTLTALAARAEKAEQLHKQAFDIGIQHQEHAKALEAELSALRARLEEAGDAARVSRDRSHDEAVALLAKLKSETARTTAAELSVAEKDAEITRLTKLVSRYAAGLTTLATTFYKDDQHQDYAKHVLASGGRFLEEAK